MSAQIVSIGLKIKMKVQNWVSLEQDMNIGGPGRMNMIKLECFNFTKTNKTLF